MVSNILGENIPLKFENFAAVQKNRNTQKKIENIKTSQNLVAVPDRFHNQIRAEFGRRLITELPVNKRLRGLLQSSTCPCPWYVSGLIVVCQKYASGIAIPYAQECREPSLADRQAPL